MSRLLLLGAGGPASSGTWTQVFSGPGGSGANNPGWNGYTLVQSIPLSAFSATGGSQIRLTFTGPTSGEDMEFGALWVGNGGGTDPYDFTGDQVQMTASGGNTITVPMGGTLLTDAKSFVKDGTNPLLVAVQWGNAAKDDMRWATGTGAGYTLYYRNTAADAATQNKSSYSNFATSSLMISKIELLI